MASTSSSASAHSSPGAGEAATEHSYSTRASGSSPSKRRPFNGRSSREWEEARTLSDLSDVDDPQDAFMAVTTRNGEVFGSPSRATPKQRSRFGTRRKKKCPADCRCSDREIEMGLCARAERGGTSSEAETSSSSRQDRVRRREVRLNWQRTPRALQESQQVASTPPLPLQASLFASSSASETDWSATEDVAPAASPSKRTTARTFSEDENASLTPQARTLRDIVRRTSHDGIVSSPTPFSRLQAGSSSEGESANEGPSLSRVSNLSRISPAGKASVQSALRLRWLRTETNTPSRTSVGEEPEERRRKRREERDRMIQKRVEEKRKAQREATQTPIAQGKASVSVEPTPLLRSPARRTTLEADIQRLHRLGRSPNPTSIAAFAAQVSPRKAASARDSRSDVRAEAAVAATSSLPREETTGHATLSVQEVNPFNSVDTPSERTRLVPSSPAKAFSFSPVRMSTQAVDSPSSPDSPRRKNSHRRTTQESEVISVNARVPTADAAEAHERMQAILTSPERQAGRSVTLDGASKASMPETPALKRILHVTLEDSGSSRGNSTRKTVRFSPHESVRQHVDRSSDSAPEDAAPVKSSDSSSSSSSGIDETDRSSLSSFGTEGGSSHVASSAGPILPQNRRGASQTPLSTGPLGTPIRLPPGAFSSPSIMVRPSKVETASTSTSMSRHVLTSRANFKTAQSVSPSTTQSLIMPGAMRAKIVSTAQTPSRMQPLHQQSERGSPPSYSSVASSSQEVVEAAGEASADSQEDEEVDVDATDLRGGLRARGDDLFHKSPETIEQPRQSTPPPQPLDQASISVSRNHLRNSLTSSVPWQHIEELNKIASPPASRAGTPDLDEVVPVAIEAAYSGEDQNDAPAESALKVDDVPRKAMEADDSIRVTLDNLFEALRHQKAEQQHQQQATGIEAAAAASLEVVPHGARSPSSRRSSVDVIESTKDQVASLQAQLSQMASQAALSTGKDLQHNQVDANEKSRLESAGSRLLCLLSSLDADHRLCAACSATRTSRSTVKRSRSAVISFASWTLLQVLILYLSLIIMRSGADHLFRTTYFDPFYPELYDSASAMALSDGLDSAAVPGATHTSWSWKWALWAMSQTQHASGTSAIPRTLSKVILRAVFDIDVDGYLNTGMAVGWQSIGLVPI